MKPVKLKSREELSREIENLRLKMTEFHEVLRGIQNQEVDALIIHGAEEDQIYTLKGAEKPYRAMVEAMNEGAITTSPEGTILYCNESFAAMVSKPARQVAGALLKTYVADTEQQKIAQFIEQGRRVKATAEAELRTADGRHFPALLSAVPFATDDLPFICIIVTNLSDVLASRESRLHLATIMHSSNDAIFSVAADGTILSWNSGAEHLFSVSVKEAIGHPVSMVATLDRPEEWAKAVAEVLERVETRHVEVACRLRNGVSVSLACSISPFRDARGNVIGTWRIIHDITRRKRLETEMQALPHRLIKAQDEEYERMVHELYDNIAQNLSALAINLSQIKAVIGKVEGGRAPNSETMVQVELAMSEVRNISSMLHPLLLESSGLPPALVHFVAGYSKRTGIPVKLEISPELGRFPRAAEETLFRIVQESLSTVHHHPGSKSAKIVMVKDDTELRLEISDYGRSLSSASADLLEPIGKKKGTGIPNMRERVRLLGGNFNIETGTQGTTLCVRLPLKMVDAAEIA